MTEVELITMQMLFDILDVPQRSLDAGACRRVAKIGGDCGREACR
jgi:hypothetical protein